MDGRGEKNKKEEMRWDEMGCQVCLLLVCWLQYLPCLPPSCSQSVGESARVRCGWRRVSFLGASSRRREGRPALTGWGGGGGPWSWELGLWRSWLVSRTSCSGRLLGSQQLQPGACFCSGYAVSGRRGGEGDTPARNNATPAKPASCTTVASRIGRLGGGQEKAARRTWKDAQRHRLTDQTSFTFTTSSSSNCQRQ